MDSRALDCIYVIEWLVACPNVWLCLVSIITDNTCRCRWWSNPWLSDNESGSIPTLLNPDDKYNKKWNQQYEERSALLTSYYACENTIIINTILVEYEERIEKHVHSRCIQCCNANAYLVFVCSVLVNM